MNKPEEVVLYESIGSGSHCSNRVLARGYKRQMMEKEAIELIKKCLLNAALGDISTGGRLMGKCTTSIHDSFNKV